MRAATPGAGLLLLLLVHPACAPAPGDPCDDQSGCGDDLVCSRPTVDGVPAPRGVCAPPRTGPDGLCAATAECAPGLFCSNDLPSEVRRRHGRCIPVQAEGQPCFRPENCGPGLTCAKDGTEIGRCAPPPPPAPP